MKTGRALLLDLSEQRWSNKEVNKTFFNKKKKKKAEPFSDLETVTKIVRRLKITNEANSLAINDLFAEEERYREKFHFRSVKNDEQLILKYLSYPVLEALGRERVGRSEPALTLQKLIGTMSNAAQLIFMRTYKEFAHNPKKRSKSLGFLDHFFQVIILKEINRVVKDEIIIRPENFLCARSKRIMSQPVQSNIDGKIYDLDQVSHLPKSEKNFFPLPKLSQEIGEYTSKMQKVINYSLLLCEVLDRFSKFEGGRKIMNDVDIVNNQTFIEQILLFFNSLQYLITSEINDDINNSDIIRRRELMARLFHLIIGFLHRLKLSADLESWGILIDFLCDFYREKRDYEKLFQVTKCHVYFLYDKMSCCEKSRRREKKKLNETLLFAGQRLLIYFYFINYGLVAMEDSMKPVFSFLEGSWKRVVIETQHNFVLGQFIPRLSFLKTLRGYREKLKGFCSEIVYNPQYRCFRGQIYPDEQMQDHALLGERILKYCVKKILEELDSLVYLDSCCCSRNLSNLYDFLRFEKFDSRNEGQRDCIRIRGQIFTTFFFELVQNCGSEEEIELINIVVFLLIEIGVKCHERFESLRMN